MSTPMMPRRLMPLVLKQVVRHRTRSALTVSGVTIAMFLYCLVSALSAGVARATERSASETTVVVYRENRFCPFTSRLPEHYGRRIERIAGVESVVPIRIVVNNCRASLDVVTFRGVTPEPFVRYAESFEFTEGSLEAWASRNDAAVVGAALAERRRVRVGDMLDAAGITVYVAGIARSDKAQDQNAAYVHLDFLQRSSVRSGDGIVTQFNVTVADPARLDEVARAIDDEFRSDVEPTHSSAESAFVARAAADIVQIASFTRYLGIGCLAAVLALIANAIALSVRERVREHAILQALGFTPGLIAQLILAEGLLLGVIGGGLGATAASVGLALLPIALTVEGVSVAFSSDAVVLMTGLGASALLGGLAGLVPAIRAASRPIASSFRAA